ncbi:MAG: MFS transporter [Chloroflexi bacterium]|nr:MFS transporter [Chloroflexota bacterium]
MDIRPMRTLWLLSVAHAINHAQAVLLPLVFLAIIKEFGVSIATIAFLAAAGSFLSGTVQLSYSWLTRYASRRNLLALGNLVFGGGMVAQAIAPGFGGFAVANVVSKLGASQQHPVGNGLIAEQFPPERRGMAISAHIAGGNVGTIAVPLIGAWLIAGLGWRWTVVLFGVPAILIGLAMYALIRESGTDRAAALAAGNLRHAFANVLRDRDLRFIYLSSVLGGGGRGLGVLNLFVPAYLLLVIGIDEGTVALMYTVLVAGSVPGPLVAGWLSDHVGRKPLILVAYAGGAISLVAFVLAGTSVPLLWLGIVGLSAFNFVESPQLQALMADIAAPAVRDASFSVYFTLAFGVGSLWTALYGAVLGARGEAAGLPIVFLVMAVSFVAAAIAVVPVRAEERVAAQRIADGADHTADTAEGTA